MRIQSSLLSALAALPSLIAATGFDCAHLNPDGVKYDLSPLGGTHSIYHVDEQDQYVVNTTYVLNICNILKGAANRGPLKCGTSKNSKFSFPCPCPLLFLVQAWMLMMQSAGSNIKTRSMAPNPKRERSR